jgi:OmpA family protein
MARGLHYLLSNINFDVEEVIVMSDKSNFLNKISRYFIPGALGMFMAYGIGTGYMSTASSGSELDTGIHESAPVTDPGPTGLYRPELKDVFFDRNSSRLRSDAKPVLDENAQVLRDEPAMYVVIESYCDSREESPARLGIKRGDAVRDYMNSRGVDAGRVLVVNKCNAYDMELVNSRDAVRLDSRVHFVPLDESLDRVSFALTN